MSASAPRWVIRNGSKQGNFTVYYYMGHNRFTCSKDERATYMSYYDAAKGLGNIAPEYANDCRIVKCVYKSKVRPELKYLVVVDGNGDLFVDRKLIISTDHKPIRGAATIFTMDIKEALEEALRPYFK